MSAASIGADGGRDYARYLEGKTRAPARGDYYLSRDGEPVQAPGRWLSTEPTLAALGIQGRQVEGADFIALMEGRHPDTGAWLRRAGANGGRGGGIDLTFSAPKSVSVIWALGDPNERELIEAAHAAAVQQAVEHLREQVPVIRRRQEGVVVEERAADVVAVEYRHTTSRKDARRIAQLASGRGVPASARRSGRRRPIALPGHHSRRCGEAGASTAGRANNASRLQIA